MHCPIAYNHRRKKYRDDAKRVWALAEAASSKPLQMLVLIAKRYDEMAQQAETLATVKGATIQTEAVPAPT